MLNALSSICDRFRRKQSIARRQRHKQIVSKRLTELRQLEADLELLVMDDELSIKENIMLIRMFYGELHEAKTCYDERRYSDAKAARKSARTTLLCIDRNVKSAARLAGVTYVIN